MTLPNECLKFFAEIIEKEIGVVYSEVNYYQLENRLEEVAKQLRIEGPEALWERAKSQGVTGAMKLLLVDIATNNETSFFRDRHVFDMIVKLVQQSFTPSSSPYRIWSAACSTGQEVYSLAMLLADLGPSAPLAYHILATDISERVLKRAEEGVYSQLEVQRGMPPAQLAKYFTSDNNDGDNICSWRVRPDIRRNLSFKKLNLLESWQGLGTFNLILCRNVLIYQTVESKKMVVTKIFDHLVPGGYLVLGGAESLIGIFDGLEYQMIENVVVYRRPAV